MKWRSFVKIVTSAFQNLSILQLVHSKTLQRSLPVRGSLYSSEQIVFEAFNHGRFWKMSRVWNLHCHWTICKFIKMVREGDLCMRTCNFEDCWTAELGHIYNIWSMMLMHMSLKILKNWCNFWYDGFNKICNEYSHLRIIILQTIYGEHFVPLNEFGPHQNNIRRTVFLILNSPKNPQNFTRSCPALCWQNVESMESVLQILTTECSSSASHG
jgi:hypothetical protein